MGWVAIYDKDGKLLKHWGDIPPQDQEVSWTEETHKGVIEKSEIRPASEWIIDIEQYEDRPCTKD